MSDELNGKFAIFNQNPLKKMHLNKKNNDSDVLLSSPQFFKKQKQNSSKIENLDLSNQGISEISKEKINNIWIVKLDLSHNCIRQYGDEFKILQNLRMLDVSFNYLKILPFNFNKFHPQLQILDASNNFLSILPQMPDQLVQLNIEYNHIHLFPQLLKNSIQILLITGNPIYELKYYAHLKEFSIDWIIYLGWNERISGQQLEQFQYWVQREQQPTFQNMIKYFLGDFFSYSAVDENGNNIIHQAALKQHLGVILGCSNVVNKNALNNQKQTPLQVGLFADKFQSVKCLLSLNVNLSQQNLVIISLLKQQLNLIQGFLQHGSDPNEQDKDGNTALHYLMNKWNSFQYPEKYGALLLYYGACPLTLNQQGFSPLHIAVKRGFIQAVQFALQYKGQSEVYDRCSHTFDISQVSGIEHFSVFDICMQQNLVEMGFTLLKSCQYYINCKPKSYSCLWKLIQQNNIKILENYFKNFNNKFQSVKQFKIQNKYTCCFSLNKQLNASFMKINLPYNFTMNNQTNNYFSLQDAPLLKEGDNDLIEYSDSSIDSHEETKGLLPVNWSRYDCNNEMNAPKLFVESNHSDNEKKQENQKNNTKIKQLVQAYYNEYLMNDNLQKKEEILIILLKLNYQINTINQMKENSIIEILQQIVHDYFIKMEIGSDAQSSIQQESLLFREVESVDQNVSTCQFILLPQAITQLKLRFDSWTLEYLLKYTTDFKEHLKLSEIHQFELFQL